MAFANTNEIRQKDGESFCLFLFFRRGDMIDRMIEAYTKDKGIEYSIVLKDLTNGSYIFKKGEKKLIPSASLIKLPIALKIYNEALNNTIAIDKKIRINTDNKVDFSLFTHMITDEYCILDFVTLMMTISDNTATNVLIDFLGIDSINNFIKKIGLKDTILQRKMMDFEAAKAGKENLTTPYDMLCMMEKLYLGDILDKNYCKQLLDIMSIVIDKDMMIRYLPMDQRVSHKTGELDNLNHDIGIVYLKNRPYILGIFITWVQDNILGRQYISDISKIVYEYMINV